MRKSFSLLEIIFSIIIIGVAFSGIPAIMAVTSQSTQNMLQSSGFYHALAKMKIVTNKPWDENNTVDFTNANIYYILDTTENAYDCVNSDGRLRSGQFEGQYRRMCYPGKNATPIAREGALYNDIDDFNGLPEENVEGFTYRYNVSYVNTPNNSGDYGTATVSTATTNTKRVRIEMADGPTFYYYSTNIGTPRPYIKNQ